MFQYPPSLTSYALEHNKELDINIHDKNKGIISNVSSDKYVASSDLIELNF